MNKTLCYNSDKYEIKVINQEYAQNVYGLQNEIISKLKEGVMVKNSFSTFYKTLLNPSNQCIAVFDKKQVIF